MSSTLAISTVSAAFSRRVLAAANAAVPSATVRLGTPTAKLSEDAKALVNLHLYRVEPNAAHANDHMPSRGRSGASRHPSQLALNLHYVLSFYGDYDNYEPDLMLAEVMLALEHEPLLSKTTVANAISDNDALADSDLDEALARLRVTRQLLSLDDFSKVWSIFYQVPYALSLAYEVNHVVLQTQDPTPLPLPVSRPQSWVAPLASFRLDSAEGPDGTPPVWGSFLRVRGSGLGQAGLGLEVDGAAVATGGITQGADKIDIPLVPETFGGGALGVGVYRLQAVAPAKAGQPAHLRARSNALPFALYPAITPGAVNAPGGGDTATGSIAIGFSPEIESHQSVRLLLDARPPAAAAQVILPGRAPVEGAAAAASLTFDFADLPRASYLVRADVDGLVSPVTLDSTTGQINGPMVTL